MFWYNLILPLKFHKVQCILIPFFLVFSVLLETLFFREGNGNPLHYSCLENPMDRGAWRAAVHGVTESDMTKWLHFHFSLSCIGEGNGNPLQCSCPENLRDSRASWAAISRVSQSRTRLQWLSSSSSRSPVFRHIFYKLLDFPSYQNILHTKSDSMLNNPR